MTFNICCRLTISVSFLSSSLVQAQLQVMGRAPHPGPRAENPWQQRQCRRRRLSKQSRAQRGQWTAVVATSTATVPPRRRAPGRPLPATHLPHSTGWPTSPHRRPKKRRKVCSHWLLGCVGGGLANSYQLRLQGSQLGRTLGIHVVKLHVV